MARLARLLDLDDPVCFRNHFGLVSEEVIGSQNHDLFVL
jgi:hypothetical protein